MRAIYFDDFRRIWKKEFRINYISEICKSFNLTNSCFFFCKTRNDQELIRMIERKKIDWTWPCVTDQFWSKAEDRESVDLHFSVSVSLPMSASLTKKATLSHWRPRNTCYAQWSNLNKVTHKTSLQTATRPSSLVEIAFTEPSRTSSCLCSKAEDSLREETGNTIVYVYISRKEEVQVPSPRLVIFSFLALSFPLSLFLVMPLDEYRAAERKCEGQRVKWKPSVRSNYRKRHVVPRILRRGNRGDLITQEDSFHGSTFRARFRDRAGTESCRISLSDSRFVSDR